MPRSRQIRSIASVVVARHHGDDAAAGTRPTNQAEADALEELPGTRTAGVRRRRSTEPSAALSERRLCTESGPKRARSVVQLAIRRSAKPRLPCCVAAVQQPIAPPGQQPATEHSHREVRARRDGLLMPCAAVGCSRLPIVPSLKGCCSTNLN